MEMITLNNYKIGKIYNIKCLKIDGNLHIPIMGEEHTDAEIGNPRLHYHVDYRFMDDDLLKRWKYKNEKEIRNPIWFTDTIKFKIINKNMKCLRNFNTYKDLDVKTLESLYENLEIIVSNNCKLCPHRGFLLEGKGIVQCPGHGLNWNLNTNKLVKRKHLISSFEKYLTSEERHERILFRKINN